MANILNTGNSTVDAIGQMNITGNVTPPNWYKTILRDNGKPYLLAICILSEICYWYRPKEIRDEQTGFVVEYRKRFKEDLLQKSYQQLADQFGESKRTVKAAMDRLEEIGVITRIWRNKVLSNGVSLTNILYIALDEEKLYEITYCVSDNKDDTSSKDDVDKITEDNSEKWSEAPINKHVTKSCNTMLQKFVGGPTENCNTLLQNNVGGVTNNCNTLPQSSVGDPTENCDTYTENTSEIIYENNSENNLETIYHIHVMRELSSYRILSGEKKISFDNADVMDKMRIARLLIKHNIQYEYLIKREEYSNSRLDELIEIMVETIALGKDVRIKDTEIPYLLIRSRFEKYDYSIMEYVLKTLNENTTRVRNVKKYLLATLYNAPSTVDNYYEFDASHDSGGIRRKEYYEESD